jgi:large subunit ribosomal protein L21
MYAVIATGGKQYKVESGQRLDIELVGEVGADVDLPIVLLVDGESVTAGAQLAGATVKAKVIGEAKGPKITGFTYKNKTNQRRRFGHRQRYSTVEIAEIQKG